MRVQPATLCCRLRHETTRCGKVLLRGRVEAPIMKRRQFIAGLAGAGAWPMVARAQPTMPVVGLLDPRSPDSTPDRMRGFRQGLRALGFVEGENVAIDYR